MKSLKNEEWRDVPGYEGMYQVSDLGRVKSLARYYSFFSTERYLEERIMKPGIHKKTGYTFYYLYKNKKRRTMGAHQLVAMAFLGHEGKGYKIVVDHKDFNPKNNKLDNLQLLTSRKNTSRKRNENISSKYPGVYKRKGRDKFTSALKINGKVVHLGNFTNEIEAHEIYEEAVKNIHKYNGDKPKFRKLIKQKLTK